MSTFVITEGTAYVVVRPHGEGWGALSARARVEWMDSLARDEGGADVLFFILSERELAESEMDKIAFAPWHNGYPVWEPGVGVGMVWAHDGNEIRSRVKPWERMLYPADEWGTG